MSEAKRRETVQPAVHLVRPGQQIVTLCDEVERRDKRAVGILVRIETINSAHGKGAPLKCGICGRSVPQRAKEPGGWFLIEDAICLICGLCGRFNDHFLIGRLLRSFRLQAEEEYAQRWHIIPDEEILDMKIKMDDGKIVSIEDLVR